MHTRATRRPFNLSRSGPSKAASGAFGDSTCVVVHHPLGPLNLFVVNEDEIGQMLTQDVRQESYAAGERRDCTPMI